VANPLLSLASAAARWLPAPLKRGLYRLGPVSRGLRTALNRSAPAGLTKTKVAAGLLAGASLLLDLQSEKDYWLGTYEMELQQAIQDLVKPDMVAFDLGANAGYFSLMLAKQVGSGGSVFAFEPLPANQERLRGNFALNSQSSVVLVAKAIADKSGSQTFHVHASDDMGKLEGSVGRETTYANSIQVETISLDDFVYARNNPVPDVIKMDIEGGEVLALIGMERLLAEARPLLFIETHGPEAVQMVWAALQKASYKVHRLGNGYPEINNASSFDWKNYVLGKPAA
jgi:FkbM family methyltransferase